MSEIAKPSDRCACIGPDQHLPGCPWGKAQAMSVTEEIATLASACEALSRRIRELCSKDEVTENEKDHLALFFGDLQYLATEFVALRDVRAGA